MKKTLCIILIALMMSLCGCEASQVPEVPMVDGSMFIVVEDGTFYEVVYHNSTKVMYVVSKGYCNVGSFTVMLNPDGTPMLWKGADDGSDQP